MANTKIKSRDEKLIEAWNEYYKCQKQSHDLYQLLDKYEEYMESNIKDLYKRGILSSDFLIDMSAGRYEGLPYKPDEAIFEDWVYRKKIIADSDISENLKSNLYNMINHWLIYYMERQKLKEKAEEIENKYSNFNRFNSLCIKNFKGFSDKNSKEENTIKIKPITLIYGPNSYGKSSIMQSLLLLNQTINENRDYENIPLSPKGNMVDLGSFEDFINNRDISKELIIELGFPAKNYINGTKVSQRNCLKEISFGLHFKKDEDLKLTKIDFYENSPGSKEKAHLLLWENNGTEKRDKRTSFFTFESENDGNNPFLQLKQLEEILKKIIYISSYRTAPERVFVTVDNAGQYVGKTGQYTTDLLLYKKNKELRKKVNEWLYNIAKYRLSLNNKSVTSVTLNDEETKVNNVNLLDLGSGIAHVLPIITQTFVSKEDMILIEEPEIHLHPRAQAELGSMFAEVIKNTENTFIIETHSENILLRLRKLIRRGELSKDDVSVIYVDKKIGKGSYCIPLKLDDNGHITNINDIPGGFFEEGFNDLFDINKEQK